MSEAGTTMVTTRPPAMPTMIQMMIAVRSRERMIYLRYYESVAERIPCSGLRATGCLL